MFCKTAVLVLAISSGFAQEAGSGNAAPMPPIPSVPVPTQPFQPPVNEWAAKMKVCGTLPILSFQDNSSQAVFLSCGPREGQPVAAYKLATAPAQFNASTWLGSEFAGLAFPGRLWRLADGVWRESASSYGSSLFWDSRVGLLVSGAGASGSHELFSNTLVQGPACNKIARVGEYIYCLDGGGIFRKVGSQWRYEATIQNANGMAGDNAYLYITTSAQYGMGGAVKPVSGINTEPVLPSFGAQMPQEWGSIVRLSQAPDGSLYGPKVIADGLESGWNSVVAGGGKVYVTNFARRGGEAKWEILYTDSFGATGVFLSNQELVKFGGGEYAYPQALALVPSTP